MSAALRSVVVCSVRALCYALVLLGRRSVLFGRCSCAVLLGAMLHHQETRPWPCVLECRRSDVGVLRVLHVLRVLRVTARKPMTPWCIAHSCGGASPPLTLLSSPTSPPLPLASTTFLTAPAAPRQPPPAPLDPIGTYGTHRRCGDDADGDSLRMLRECVRVLRPGAKYLMVTYSPPR